MVAAIGFSYFAALSESLYVGPQFTGKLVPLISQMGERAGKHRELPDAQKDWHQTGKLINLVSERFSYGAVGWFYGEAEELRYHLRRLHQRFPDKPVILSEFGADAALGRTDREGVWDPREEGEESFAYGAYGKTHSEDYQVELYRTHWEIAREEAYVVGILPWIFSDFHHPSPWFERSLVPGHVLKGVVTRDRKPKRVYYELQRYYGS